MKTGIFAAGCFWKPDLEFEKLKGVKKMRWVTVEVKNSNTTYEKAAQAQLIMPK